MAEEGRSRFYSIVERFAAKQRASEDTGENIAGTAGAEGDAISLFFIERSGETVVADVANLVVGAGNAGDDDLLRSELRQLTADVGHFFCGQDVGGIRTVQKQTGFGIVRSDNRRLADQLAHFADKGCAEDGIQRAVVSHCRVDDNQRVCCAETRRRFGDNGRLAAISQKAAVDGVVRIAEFLPFIHELLHMRREISKGEGAVRQIVAEQRCRERADLNTHG